MRRWLRVGFLLGAFFAVPGLLLAQIESGTWQSLTPMPLARQEISAAVLNGKIYVLAGYDDAGSSTNSVQVYNPPTHTWMLARPLPIFNNHNAAAVAAGKLYTFGGVTNRAFVYNPANDSWTAVASMAVQHGNTAAVGVIGDQIYVAGGTQGSVSLRNLEKYSPSTNTWTNLAPMNVPRNHAAGAVIGGKFYVVGGRGSAEAPAALEVYNPQTNTWSRRANMLTGRSGIAAAAVNGELWVFGGENPGIRNQVEVYNPASNSWRRLPPMPTPRHGIWAAVIGNHIYLPGGGLEPDIAPSNVNEVFTVNRNATFGNISSRAKVETGDNVLIGGFIVRGATSKRIVVRALGPTLPLSGTLTDPNLELYNSVAQIIAANDNWQNAPNRQEIVDSGFAPPRPSEAAILTRLPPGAYTAIVRGANSSTGIALVEVYDLEAGSDAKLANISARALVQTGENVLIDGVIVGGNYPMRVIVRAIGPSMSVPGPLLNPTLSFYDANGQLLASNDNWRSTQQADIVATGLAPRSDLESAIIRTLMPGNYTAIVRGVGNSSGIALLDFFDLD